MRQGKYKLAHSHQNHIPASDCQLPFSHLLNLPLSLSFSLSFLSLSLSFSVSLLQGASGALSGAVDVGSHTDKAVPVNSMAAAWKKSAIPRDRELTQQTGRQT